MNLLNYLIGIAKSEALSIIFLELWCFVDGSNKKQSADNPNGLTKWTTKNARVISWILNLFEPSVALNLRSNQATTNMRIYFW